jgi:hypothetical protein
LYDANEQMVGPVVGFGCPPPLNPGLVFDAAAVTISRNGKLYPVCAANSQFLLSQSVLFTSSDCTGTGYGYGGEPTPNSQALFASNIVSRYGGRTVLLRPETSGGRQVVTYNSSVNTEGTCAVTGAGSASVFPLVEEADLSALYALPLMVR